LGQQPELSLDYDPTFTKNIRDKELEEQLRKEAEEKARQEGTDSQQPQNNMLRQRSGTPGSVQPFGR